MLFIQAKKVPMCNHLLVMGLHLHLCLFYPSTFHPWACLCFFGCISIVNSTQLQNSDEAVVVVVKFKLVELVVFSVSELKGPVGLMIQTDNRGLLAVERNKVVMPSIIKFLFLHCFI